MRVGRSPACGFGGADAAGGFQPVHARHLHVHQHQIVRLAGRARRRPGFDRRFAVVGDGRAMAEPGEQRAREQRVDLVVLGHQDRQVLCRSPAQIVRFPLAVSAGRCLESVFGGSRAASEAARTGLTR